MTRRAAASLLGHCAGTLGLRSREGSEASALDPGHSPGMTIRSPPHPLEL